MGYNQLLPFERNRYYVGKLLTSADFQAEQAYFGNKRRFMNGILYGSGVICGLGVYNLDDVFVMVESGVAVDGMGRELVLDKSVMLRLSAVEGFDSLSGDRASLMLCYEEEPVHPVYSLERREHSDEEYEHNRIREGWRLYLTDVGEEVGFSTEFLSSSHIYSDGDYEVTISIPASVSCSSRVKATVSVRRLSAADKTVALDCTIQTPSFVNDSGDYELVVKMEEMLPAQDETITREYWLTAQGSPAPESLLVAKSNFLRVTIDGQTKHPDENLMLKVSVLDIPVEELVEYETGRVSLEARQLPTAGDAVRLADITLQRSKNTYIIEKVEERGAKRYIRTMSNERLRREFSAYFDEARSSSASVSAEAARYGGDSFAAREPVYASGICEIPLGANLKKGSTVFSDEIMHGLGKGNIYVSVGVEYLSEDKRDGETTRQTIYGNPELFAAEESPVPYAETAVKVLEGRGSFVVAARLLKPTNHVLLVMRWVAIKLPAADDKTLLHKISGKSISATPPTVVLGTRENHYFAVRFHNMEPCSLIYELSDKDSGEITSDGIYTAPAREGVYEIRISVADMPIISTYAYAVVKKKTFDDGE